MAKTRRMRGPKGSGTISLRPDGRWHGRFDLGRGPDGKRDRKSIYGATEREVVVEMQRLHGHAADGDTPLASSPTIGSYARSWLALRDDLAAATRRSYDYSIERVLIPGLGAGTRVEKITRPAINKWCSAGHGRRSRRHRPPPVTHGRSGARVSSLPARRCRARWLGARQPGDACRPARLEARATAGAPRGALLHGGAVASAGGRDHQRDGRRAGPRRARARPQAWRSERVDVGARLICQRGRRTSDKHVQRIPRKGDHAAHLAVQSD